MSGPKAEGASVVPQPPSSRRRVLGVALVVASYLLGWPTVALAGALAARLGEPLLIAVGGPALLAIAHLAFAVGSWLAGGDRVLARLRGRARG
jgi:hypothetical protein